MVGFDSTGNGQQIIIVIGCIPGGVFIYLLFHHSLPSNWGDKFRVASRRLDCVVDYTYETLEVKRHGMAAMLCFLRPCPLYLQLEFPILWVTQYSVCLLRRGCCCFWVSCSQSREESICV